MAPSRLLAGTENRALPLLKARLHPEIPFEPDKWWRCFLRSLLRDTMAGPPPETLHVVDRFLFDACSEEVVLRGVNKMAVWESNDPTCTTIFPQIALTGANAVRIVWLTDGSGNPNATVANMDAVIGNCLKNNMIPIIEAHDATGDWSQLTALVDYWTRSEVVAVLNKYQRYLLLNIGNEVGDDTVTDEEYQGGYETAIARIRGAGIAIPLIIDAAGFGQEMRYILNNASYLIGKDPQHNLIFSLHVWWHYHANASADFAQAINDVVAANIPFIVGEFAGVCQNCDDANNDSPYSEILMLCYQHSVGWLAWEWGPGNELGQPPCAAMNMTADGQFATLQAGWAESVAVTHPFSIQKTSVRPYALVNGECECDVILRS